ncbi:uncharacterized protein N7473_002827 [Penicillium subrubescens]|uniref:uncharacterized protein n=1 Tax=Penicillium subrubescens TaxID=1316194 RepID=UPI002545496D|nr:uncharacterized protein N7473_002827 [Penicillium subrubescens]KAJ5905911.1 hypothetical protein N7473_002827 [Penicillium subrubescens]
MARGKDNDEPSKTQDCKKRHQERARKAWASERSSLSDPEKLEVVRMNDPENRKKVKGAVEMFKGGNTGPARDIKPLEFPVLLMPNGNGQFMLRYDQFTAVVGISRLPLEWDGKKGTPLKDSNCPKKVRELYSFWLLKLFRPLMRIYHPGLHDSNLRDTKSSEFEKLFWDKPPADYGNYISELEKEPSVVIPVEGTTEDAYKQHFLNVVNMHRAQLNKRPLDSNDLELVLAEESDEDSDSGEENTESFKRQAEDEDPVPGSSSPKRRKIDDAQSGDCKAEIRELKKKLAQLQDEQLTHDLRQLRSKKDKMISKKDHAQSLVPDKEHDQREHSEDVTQIVPQDTIAQVQEDTTRVQDTTAQVLPWDDAPSVQEGAIQVQENTAPVLGDAPSVQDGPSQVQDNAPPVQGDPGTAFDQKNNGGMLVEAEITPRGHETFGALRLREAPQEYGRHMPTVYDLCRDRDSSPSPSLKGHQNRRGMSATWEPAIGSRPSPSALVNELPLRTRMDRLERQLGEVRGQVKSTNDAVISIRDTIERLYQFQEDALVSQEEHYRSIVSLLQSVLPAGVIQPDLDLGD